MGLASTLPRPLTGLLWALVVLGVLIVAAWVALAVLFPAPRVKEMVRARLESAMNRDVHFDDASIGLFPPVRLTVKGLRVSEPEGLERGDALAVRAVHLDLDVLALLQRNVVVRKLILDQPSVRILIREDGTTNLDGFGLPPVEGADPALQGGAAGEALGLAINRLELRSARFLVDDIPREQRSTFTVNSGLALKMRDGARVDLDGRTVISDVAVGTLDARSREDMNTKLAPVEWEIDHTGAFDAEANRLAFERLALKFGRAEFAFVGIVDQPGSKARVNLRAQGDGVDLSEILDIVSVADARMLNGLSGDGQVRFDLRVHGALGPGRLPGLTGNVDLADGAFRYPGAAATVRELSFHAVLSGDTLEIPDLQAIVEGESGESPVRATLFVTRFADPIVRFSLRGDVDLAALAPLAAPEGVDLGGRAAVDIEGAGLAKDPAGMQLSGSAELQNVRLETPDLEKPVEQINGTIAFSSTRAEVRNLTATAGASSFTMNATVDRPFALTARPGTPEAEGIPPATVSFQLGSPHLDLTELLPPTPGASVLPNAVGEGRIVIERLKRDRLDVENVSASVELEPGIVHARKFDFDGYGGKVEGRAKFDLREAAPVFAVSARIEKVEAGELLSAWTPIGNLLQGTLSTNIELSGATGDAATVAQTLTAVGLAAVRNGSLGPTPVLESIAEFTKMPAFKEIAVRDGSIPFAIEDGRVSFREVRLAGRTGDWRAAGSIGFDGTLDYAVSTTLPGELAARLGSAGTLLAGALRDHEGDILMDFRVYGDTKSPKISWDKNAMLERLMGKSSGALSKKGENLGEKALESLGGAGVTPDTSMAEYQARIRALADSLRKKKAKDLLKDLFPAGRDSVW